MWNAQVVVTGRICRAGPRYFGPFRVVAALAVGDRYASPACPSENSGGALQATGSATCTALLEVMHSNLNTPTARSCINAPAVAGVHSVFAETWSGFVPLVVSTPDHLTTCIGAADMTRWERRRSSFSQPLSRLIDGDTELGKRGRKILLRIAL